jgi:hypothetical protein
MLDTDTLRIDPCELCGDMDHCLPRWEDDGGAGPHGGRRPAAVRRLQHDDPEGDWEHHESPSEGYTGRSV